MPNKVGTSFIRDVLSDMRRNEIVMMSMNPRLTIYDMMVADTIIGYYNMKTEIAYPSLSTIAAASICSRRKVADCIKSLSVNKVILYDKIAYSSNQYRLGTVLISLIYHKISVSSQEFETFYCAQRHEGTG